MLNKPDTCNSCPLCATGKGFVPDTAWHSIRPWISKDELNAFLSGKVLIPQLHPLYLFIGEAPGKHEVEHGEPFVGSAGFVLREWGIKLVPELARAFEQGRAKLSNVLRCMPPTKNGRAYPTGDTQRTAEACCRQYDDWARADLVVLLGEKPQRYWFRDELEREDLLDKRAGRELKGVLGRIGRVYERDSKRWVFAPHPAAVLRQPALAEAFQAALQIAGDGLV